MIKRVLAGLGLLVAVGGAGPAAVGQCVLDWADGFAAPGVAGTTGSTAVHALAVFNDGSGPALYVGGDFYAAGAIRAKHVAKWDGTAWSALGDGTNGRVYALAVYDDGSGPALYAGGEFETAGGVLVWRIAKWDGATWSALDNGVSGSKVSALAVFDDGSGPTLYAGGEFETAGGVTVNGIAKWDGQSWSALSSGMGGGWPDAPYVSALAVFDDGSGPALYAGGWFFSAGGVGAAAMARWDGASWSPVGYGMGGGGFDGPRVRALTVLDDGSGPALYAAGKFTYAGLVTANHVAKWDGSAWSALGTGLGGVNYPEGRSLTVFDDGSGPALYVGGEFATAGDVSANHIARWDGSTWSALGSGMIADWPDVGVLALAVYDDGRASALYAGGDFSSADGIAANHIARWDGATFSPLSVGHGMSQPVYALEVYDDGNGPGLYAGGHFSTAGAATANCIARWDGSGWSPVGDGVDPGVIALAVFDDGGGPALYAGGGFHTAGGVDAHYVAKWDGTSWTALGSGMEGGYFVAALAVFDDGSGPALYAGGWFETAGGVSANAIAKWDGSSWSALSSGMTGSSNPYVHVLAVFDDGSGPALYAGGRFETAGGVSANHIAKWDGASWSPLGSGMSGDSQPWVYSLTVFADGSGPALYVGGNFEFADGVSAIGIAKWDGQSFSPVGSGLSDPGVHALAVHDDGSGPALYVGGMFQRAGGVVVRGIARWDGLGWSPLGVGTGAVYAFQGYDDGRGRALYAGGNLIYAGGRPSANIAKWGCVGELLLGDVNCDGTVDHFDIDPFVLALVNSGAYELTYPECDIRTADSNHDGAVDAFDIDRFVELLTGP